MASSPWNRGIYSMAIKSIQPATILVQKECSNMGVVRKKLTASMKWFNRTNNSKPLHLVLILLGLTAGVATAAVDDQKPADRLPVTTSSAAAARYFENGMVNYEKH